MKALGHSSAGVAWHYLKFVIAIGLVGIAFGIGAGIWLGRGLADALQRVLPLSVPDFSDG